MKTIIKGFVLSILILSLVISCSDNPTDSTTTDTNQTVTDKFQGVPTGEVVSIEKRDSVLTGSNKNDSNSKTLAGTAAQKWWLQKVSKIDYTSCTDYEDQDITLEDTYFAFKTSGGLYYKTGTDGSEQYATSWEWSDESKSAILLDEFPGISLEILSLNDNEVVYASSQTDGDCKVITWEQFGSPHLEEQLEEEEEGEEEEEDNTDEEENNSRISENTLEHDPYRSIMYLDNGDGFLNNPKFPSDQVILREYDIPGAPKQYILTIGGGGFVSNESEIEIIFDELVEGRMYYIDLPSAPKNSFVEVRYDNTEKTFQNSRIDPYDLEKMQEQLSGLTSEISSKGYIEIIHWSEEYRNLLLRFHGVHLVHSTLCSDDCDIFSPDYDGGWQYETDYVHLYGYIEVIYEHKLIQ